MKTSYGDITDRVIARLAASHRDPAALEREAACELELLLSLGKEDRRRRIRLVRTRCHGLYLVDHLLAESQRRLAGDPPAALDLAECAQEVAFRLNRKAIGAALVLTEIARAAAHRGDALRAAGDLATADSLLARARRLFEEKGNANFLVLGEILVFVANLRRDQERPDEAEEALREATAAYDECGQKPPS